MALERGGGASGTGTPVNIPDAASDGLHYGRKNDAWVQTNAADTTNTPSGAIAATTVQNAINELDTEKQPLDAELTALAGLTSAADKGIQFTGSGTAAVYDLTAAGKALLDDADATAQRVTLGLVIGTNVQAYDAELAAIAGLTSAADKGIQFTGAGTAATFDLTAAGKALLDDAAASNQRTTLGLVIGTDVQAYDAELAAIAGLTSAADKGIQFTGSGTAAVYDLTAAGKALLDDANAAAQLVTLGLTATAAELNIMDGVTATAAELSKLAGTPAGLTSTEIGYLDGVTSAIQAQIDALIAGATPSGGYHRNRIINGDFTIAQRGTSFTAATVPLNSDDTYLLDRWTLLSDGNDIVDVTQNTAAAPTPPGARYCIALDVETIDKKFGIIQFIERDNCDGLLGSNAVLTFKAKVAGSGKLDNLKAAVITWSSTADALTSDVVSAWNVEGTDPTLVANWTYDSIPANLNPTTSWATYQIAVNIDTASAANVAVFIWSDVTDTDLGDFLYITDVQLEAGTAATTFERRLRAYEDLMCKRYYIKFGGHGITADVQYIGYQAASSAVQHYLPFPVEMRTTPTAAVSGSWALTAIAAPATTSPSPRGLVISATKDGSAGLYAFGTNTVDDFVHATAEL